MNDYEQRLAFATKLATQAGEIMREHFALTGGKAEWKSDATPLTVADTAVNQLVIDAVKSSYPGEAVIGEEDSLDGDFDNAWICDPIDGTMPYSHGIPTFTFNLAFAEKGVVKVAVVYDPIMERMVTASKGQGAKLNGQPITIADTNPKGNAKDVIVVDVWGRSGSAMFTNEDIYTETLSAVQDKNRMALYLCSSAFCSMNIVLGNITGVLFSGKNQWDLAAVTLVVAEAGGVVTDIYGKPITDATALQKGAILGNPTTHKFLLDRTKDLFVSQELMQ